MKDDVMSVLFEPMQMGKMEIKNRFVRSATYDGLADRGGEVSERQIELYEALAGGGIGLIVSGLAPVHPSGKMSPTQNCIFDDSFIPGLRRLTDAVHRHNARIAVQLFHAGRERARVDTKSQNNLAPSVLEDDPYFRGPHHAATDGEIWEIVESFGQAARRAREAGFDAVQIHGAHAYLFSQFLSPFTNRREDAWGGPLENRLRLHREVYSRIRVKVGNDYPVLIKLGVEDGFAGGLAFVEGKLAAEEIAGLGFDALEVSSGLRGKGYNRTEFHTGITREDREAYFRPWCAEIRRNVTVPIILVGGLRTFGVTEQIVLDGENKPLFHFDTPFSR